MLQLYMYDMGCVFEHRGHKQSEWSARSTMALPPGLQRVYHDVNYVCMQAFSVQATTDSTVQHTVRPALRALGAFVPVPGSTNVLLMPIQMQSGV